jgi:lipid-binding SYLF domain-containing protein
MKSYIKSLSLGSLLGVVALALSNCAHEPVTQTNAANSSSRQIASESRAALNKLYANNPAARKLGREAAAVLVFPRITKGAFIVGAAGGNGALFDRSGAVTGYYQSAGASYGFEAGIQQFSYALILMNSKEVRKLNEAAGWEFGSSPSVVIVNTGMVADLTTKTAEEGTYAFTFDQKGLMAGISLKGTKITRIHPQP